MPDRGRKDVTILVIDAGTQSIRAAIIDLAGNIKHLEKTPIEPYYSMQPGWAEQEPDYYWKKLCLTTNRLMKKYPSCAEKIRAMSMTTQRNTMINLDKNGQPLRPAIVWLDQRKAALEKWL